MSNGNGFGVFIAVCFLMVGVGTLAAGPQRAAGYDRSGALELVWNAVQQSPQDMFPSVIRTYEWDEGWQPKLRTTALRDGQDRVESLLIEEWIDGTQTWVNQGKVEFEYSTGDSPDLETSYTWSGMWEPAARTFYVYDTQGNVESETREYFDEGDWVSHTRTSWARDGNGDPIEVINQVWANDDWRNSYRMTYLYANSLVIDVMEYFWMTNAWVLLGRTVYTYSGDQVTEELMQSWDGMSWQDTQRYTTTYNGGLREIETYENWFGTFWAPISREVYDSYDDQDRPLTIISQFYMDPDWVNLYLTEYEYDVGTSVDEGELAALPVGVALLPNYPNPFNPTTTIEFSLPMKSSARLTVYNVLGQQVRTLIDSELAAGTHMVEWDGTDSGGSHVASGIYFYRLSTDAGVASRKMLLLQ